MAKPLPPEEVARLRAERQMRESVLDVLSGMGHLVRHGCINGFSASWDISQPRIDLSLALKQPVEFVPLTFLKENTMTEKTYCAAETLKGLDPMERVACAELAGHAGPHVYARGLGPIEENPKLDPNTVDEKPVNVKELVEKAAKSGAITVSKVPKCACCHTEEAVAEVTLEVCLLCAKKLAEGS